MRINGHRYTVDYGHLALLALIGGAIVWYLADARGVSTSVNNILLVQPTALFALVMTLLILPQCFKRADAAEQPQQQDAEDDPLAPQLPTERSEIARMALLGAALGVFVFSLDIVGFDIAIFLFTAAAMALCGERRPVRLVVYALLVTLAAVYGFRALIPFPMATTIL